MCGTATVVAPYPLSTKVPLGFQSGSPLGVGAVEHGLQYWQNIAVLRKADQNIDQEMLIIN